eukprot:8756753-Pyramimonas_sp.AAC.1
MEGSKMSSRTVEQRMSNSGWKSPGAGRRLRGKQAPPPPNLDAGADVQGGEAEEEQGEPAEEQTQGQGEGQGEGAGQDHEEALLVFFRFCGFVFV